MTDKVCVADDCFRIDIKARGLCGRCYARAQRGAIPVPPLVRVNYPEREFSVKELRICRNCYWAFEALPTARTKYCSRSCYWESKRQPEDDLGYMAAHDRVRVFWGPAKQYSCIECGKQAADWAYDGTDPSERYGANSVGTHLHYSIWPEFYMPMCRGCHLRRDAALRREGRQELSKYDIKGIK